MTLFNKIGRELDKKLDGWKDTILYLSAKILLIAIIFSGLIILICF